MNIRFVSAALIGACFSSVIFVPAAVAQAVTGPVFMDTSLAAILVVCTSAVRDKFDMNDDAALAQYGLHAVSDESEADMRKDHPGIEMAIARFPNGAAMVGYTPGGTCNTLLSGADRLVVRDRLISELVSHGAKRQEMNGADLQEQVLFFGQAVIDVTTNDDSVAVEVQLNE